MKRLTCWFVQRALPEREVGAVSKWKERFVTKHLFRCEPCAQEQRWQRLTRDALRSQAPIAAPDDFTERAMARFTQVRRRSPLWGALAMTPQLAPAGLLLALAYYGINTARVDSPSDAGHEVGALIAASAPQAQQARPTTVAQPEVTSQAPGLQLAALTPPPPRRTVRRAPRTHSRVVVSPPTAKARLVADVVEDAPVPDPQALIRRSSALMSEREYGAALAHCQEAATVSIDEASRQQARDLAGQLLAASGDAALEEALRADETNEVGEGLSDSMPEPDTGVRLATLTTTGTVDPLDLKRRADALAQTGADQAEVATQYRAAQRALRDAVATQRTPQAMLALAGAHEAVSERDAALEIYVQLVESFPETEESQTAAERLVHLT